MAVFGATRAESDSVWDPALFGGANAQGVATAFLAHSCRWRGVIKIRGGRFIVREGLPQALILPALPR